MTTITTQSRLGELVAERPGRAKLLEKYGLDYCCHGKRQIAEVCAEKNLDMEGFLQELRQSDEDRPADESDWRTAPMGQLADHIVATHHAYLNENLPRLHNLILKVLHAHGSKHPELARLLDVFTELRSELESHMLKEEKILFPLIRQLETAGTLLPMHCGSVNNPIRVMEHEHDTAGAALEALRALTNHYTPPANVCNTYRVMLDGLAELEADLQTHIHKENNILFPRAAKREAELAASV